MTCDALACILSEYMKRNPESLSEHQLVVRIPDSLYKPLIKEVQRRRSVSRGTRVTHADVVREALHRFLIEEVRS